MSIFDFLSYYAGRASNNKFSTYVTDEQRRGFMLDGLAQVNHNHSIKDASALIEIKASSDLVYFPPDYKSAEEAALLAVEYGYSAEYVRAGGYDVGFISSVSAPIYDPRALRRKGAIPPPQPTSAKLYGVSRKALRLHRPFDTDRSEALIYKALYQITDRRQEIIILDNPEDETEIEIQAASTKVYRYIVTLTEEGEDEVKIGSTKSHSARNLAAAIKANEEDEGVTAEAIGEIVVVRGYTEDADFTITTDSSSFKIESYEATNNLTEFFSNAVVRWMEYREFDYLATETGKPLSDALRKLYYDKAAAIKEEVLDMLAAT